MAADKRLLLLELARQLYEDCRFVSQNNPTQTADDETCQMYNALLLEVQWAYHGQPYVARFREMPPRNVKYKEAMVVTGQLYTLLHFYTEHQIPIQTGDAPPVPVSLGAPGTARGGAAPRPVSADEPTRRMKGAGFGASDIVIPESDPHAHAGTGSSPGSRPKAAAPAGGRGPAPQPSGADTSTSGFLTADELKVSFDDLK